MMLVSKGTISTMVLICLYAIHINSTIFKTFNNDIDGVINKIGIFNHTFGEISNEFKIGGISGVKDLFLGNITESDIEKIREYNSLVTAYQQELPGGVSAQTAWNRTMLDASTSAQRLVESNNGAVVSEEALTLATQQQTLSAKAATIATKAFAFAGNNIAMWAISAVIGSVVKALDNWIHRAEKAAETAEEFSNSFNEMQKTHRDNTATIDGFSNEYAKLSKGVNQLGDNVSLSKNEYERYHEITNQVAELMPNLVRGWDLEGNAILTVKGNLADLNEEYKKYKQKKAIESYYAVDEDGNRVVDSVFDNYKNKVLSNYAGYTQVIENSTPNGIDTYKRRFVTQEEAADIFQQISSGEIEVKRDKEGRSTTYYGIFDKAGIGDVYDNYLNGKISLSDFQSQAASKAIELQNEIDAYVFQVSNSALEYAQTLPDYSKLGNLSSYVSTIINNLSTDFINSEGLETRTGIEFFVSNLISSIHENKNGISDAFSDLFKIDLSTTELSPQELQNQINPLVKKIADGLGIENTDGLKAVLGFDIDDLEEKYNKAISKFGNTITKSGKNSKTALDQFFKDNSINDSSEIDYWNQVTKDAQNVEEAIEMYKKSGKYKNSSDILSFSTAWKQLENNTGVFKDKESTKETYEDLMNLAESGQLTVEAFENTTGANTFLNQIGLSAEEATKKINGLVEETTQLSSMSDGIKAITSAYDEKKESKNNTVSAETLNSMYDTLGIKEWNTATKESWKNYKSIAGDGSKTMKDLEVAQNNLASAYINSNNFLSKLKKSNQDYYDGLLTAMGITNAHEITTNLLNDKISKSIQKKLEAKSASIDFSNATEDEINELVSYGGQLGLTEKQINSFILKQSLANNNPLATNFSIESLVLLGKQLTLTGKQLTWYNKLKKAANTLNAAKSTYVDDETVNNANRDVKKYTQKLENHQDIESGANVTKGDKSDPGKNKDTDKSISSQIIDWIERKLSVLQSKIDLTKAKFENLFSFQAKKNNLQKKIEQTANLLNKQNKAIDKYSQKAKSINLSPELKKKVQNGDIKGNLSDLIATYGEDQANKISKYQEYWDKIKDGKKSVQELTTSLKDLQDQKDQLYIDKADQKLSTLEAEEELVNTAEHKNELEKQKIRWVQQSYNYQIKIAKREKDSAKVAELRAQKEKEILDIRKQILQNTLDENEARRSYNDARYENATTTAEKSEIIQDNISTYQSDKKARNEAYKESIKEKQTKKYRSKVAASENLGSTDLMGSLSSSSASEKIKKKILNLIKKGKVIPKSILNAKGVKNNPALLEKLQQYNADRDDVMAEIDKEIDSIKQDKKTENQKTDTAIREEKEKDLQNHADEAESNYNLTQIREENAHSAKEKNKYESESRDYLKEQYTYLKAIAKLNGDETEYARLNEEEQSKLAESYKKEFDNIRAEYEHITGLQEAKMSTIQSEISALEAQGKTVSDSFYQSLISSTKANKSVMEQEYKDLAEKLATLDYGSDEWYDAVEAMGSLNQSIIQCDESVAGFQKTINQLQLDKLNLNTQRLDYTKQHIEFLIDMLSHEELTSTDAFGLTTDGFTTLSLYLDEIANNEETIKSVSTEWAEFRKQVALGITGMTAAEIDAKNNEYAESVRSLIKENADWEDSFKSLVEEAFNVQLDALDELIEKRKEALQTAKDMYDYEKKVAEQTKNIANLEKQIAALTGDESEEARMKIQQLNVNLEDAREELQETEYDKWLSDQEDMLDSLSEDISDIMSNVLKDTDSLIEQVRDVISDNLSVIIERLSELGYGNSSSVGTTTNIDGGSSTTTLDYGTGQSSTVNYDSDGNYKNSSSTDIRENKLNKLYDIFRNDKYLKRNKDVIPNPLAFYLQQKLGNNEGYPYLTEDGVKALVSVLGAPSGLADAVLQEGYFGQHTESLINLMKAYGFYNGGIAQVPSGILHKTGEDGWVLARNGEGFISPENVSDMKEFMRTLPLANHIMDNLNNLPVNLPDYNVLSRPASPSVNIGDIDIHLDGSNVVDAASFIDTFRRSTAMQNVIRDATIGQATKPYNNRLSI